MLSLITSHADRLRLQTERKLEEYNKPSLNFFVLISFSSAIASLGVLSNNTAVVIGGMMVAPLITPIFGFSLSLIAFKFKKLLRSVISIFLGTILAIAVAYLVGIIINMVNGQIFITEEILLRSKADLISFLIALLSGLVGAFAYAKPKIPETLTGIAIAVSLIPPLAVIGSALAMSEWGIATQSFLLYSFNLAGICFGSILMFIILGFGKVSID